MSDVYSPHITLRLLGVMDFEEIFEFDNLRTVFATETVI